MTPAMVATAPLLLLLLLAAVLVQAADDPRLDRFKYTTHDHTGQRYDPQENEVLHWRTQTQQFLAKKLEVRPVEGVAKNVILFLGDGMSVATITASRIYLGQLSNHSGENERLSFEEFPFTGLSKTYCVNKQVADSACSSTAYLGGVKANYGTLGVTASVPRGNCTLSGKSEYHVDTFLDWAQAEGKATGLVTTTRITHASPAGHYAKIADRDWESDYNFQTEKYKADPRTCQDIASQLVHNSPGKNVKVLMGGGRAKFLPVNPMNSAWGEGERRDEANLIDDWHKDKEHRGKAIYVADRQQLLDIDIKHTDYLLGLFNADHMKYHLEEGSDKQPSLAEMTETAIKLLRKEKRGFYLFVEGGRIDMAHHKNWARRALDETVEFHKAVQTAVDMVDFSDTLVVVTADHSHTMSMAGYNGRGDDILGGDLRSEFDNLPYPSLSYANGPSAEINRTGYRKDISKDDLQNASYAYPSLVPLVDETHGGDDVAVFARGPWAHLLVGNYEQTLIPHVMAYAAKLGPMANTVRSSASSLSLYPATILLCLLPLALLTRHH